MTSPLVLLRHDITAAQNWIDDRLTILKKRRLSPQDLQSDFEAKYEDIKYVVQKGEDHLLTHTNQDPVLEQNIERLHKSWKDLCEYFDITRVPKTLTTSSDTESFHSSVTSYTSRFESAESDDARKYIPRLTPLYRAVIRSKVRHHRRSGSRSPASSVSGSTRSSHYSGSPRVSPDRQHSTTTSTSISTLVTTHTRRSREIAHESSDSEPELLPFPWVNVNEDEWAIPDIYSPASNAARKSVKKRSKSKYKSSRLWADDFLQVENGSSIKSYRDSATRFSNAALHPPRESIHVIDSDSGVSVGARSSFQPISTDSTTNSQAGSIETITNFPTTHVEVAWQAKKRTKKEQSFQDSFDGAFDFHSKEYKDFETQDFNEFPAWSEESGANSLQSLQGSKNHLSKPLHESHVVDESLASAISLMTKQTDSRRKMVKKLTLSCAPEEARQPQTRLPNSGWTSSLHDQSPNMSEPNNYYTAESSCATVPVKIGKSKSARKPHVNVINDKQVNKSNMNEPVAFVEKLSLHFSNNPIVNSETGATSEPALSIPAFTNSSMVLNQHNRDIRQAFGELPSQQKLEKQTSATMNPQKEHPYKSHQIETAVITQQRKSSSTTLTMTTGQHLESRAAIDRQFSLVSEEPMSTKGKPKPISSVAGGFIEPHETIQKNSQPSVKEIQVRGEKRSGEMSDYSSNWKSSSETEHQIFVSAESQLQASEKASNVLSGKLSTDTAASKTKPVFSVKSTQSGGHHTQSKICSPCSHSGNKSYELTTDSDMTFSATDIASSSKTTLKEQHWSKAYQYNKKESDILYTRTAPECQEENGYVTNTVGSKETLGSEPFPSNLSSELIIDSTFSKDLQDLTTKTSQHEQTYVECGQDVPQTSAEDTHQSKKQSLTTNEASNTSYSHSDLPTASELAMPTISSTQPMPFLTAVVTPSTTVANPKTTFNASFAQSTKTITSGPSLPAKVYNASSNTLQNSSIEDSSKQDHYHPAELRNAKEMFLENLDSMLCSDDVGTGTPSVTCSTSDDQLDSVANNVLDKAESHGVTYTNSNQQPDSIELCVSVLPNNTSVTKASGCHKLDSTAVHASATPDVENITYELNGNKTDRMRVCAAGASNTHRESETDRNYKQCDEAIHLSAVIGTQSLTYFSNSQHPNSEEMCIAVAPNNSRNTGTFSGYEPSDLNDQAPTTHDVSNEKANVSIPETDSVDWGTGLTSTNSLSNSTSDRPTVSVALNTTATSESHTIPDTISNQLSHEVDLYSTATNKTHNVTDTTSVHQLDSVIFHFPATYDWPNQIPNDSDTKLDTIELSTAVTSGNHSITSNHQLDPETSDVSVTSDISKNSLDYQLESVTHSVSGTSDIFSLTHPKSVSSNSHSATQTFDEVQKYRENIDPTSTSNTNSLIQPNGSQQPVSFRFCTKSSSSSQGNTQTASRNQSTSATIDAPTTASSQSVTHSSGHEQPVSTTSCAAVFLGSYDETHTASELQPGSATSAVLVTRISHTLANLSGDQKQVGTGVCTTVASSRHGNTQTISEHKPACATGNAPVTYSPHTVANLSGDQKLVSTGVYTTVSSSSHGTTQTTSELQPTSVTSDALATCIPHAVASLSGDQKLVGTGVCTTVSSSSHGATQTTSEFQPGSATSDAPATCSSHTVANLSGDQKLVSTGVCTTVSFTSQGNLQTICEHQPDSATSDAPSACNPHTIANLSGDKNPISVGFYADVSSSRHGTTQKTSELQPDNTASHTYASYKICGATHTANGLQLSDVGYSITATTDTNNGAQEPGDCQPGSSTSNSVVSISNISSSHQLDKVSYCANVPLDTYRTAYASHDGQNNAACLPDNMTSGTRNVTNTSHVHQTENMGFGIDETVSTHMDRKDLPRSVVAYHLATSATCGATSKSNDDQLNTEEYEPSKSDFPLDSVEVSAKSKTKKEDWVFASHSSSTKRSDRFQKSGLPEHSSWSPVQKQIDVHSELDDNKESDNSKITSLEGPLLLLAKTLYVNPPEDQRTANGELPSSAVTELNSVSEFRMETKNGFHKEGERHFTSEQSDTVESASGESFSLFLAYKETMQQQTGTRNEESDGSFGFKENFMRSDSTQVKENQQKFNKPDCSVEEESEVQHAMNPSTVTNTINSSDLSTHTQMGQTVLCIKTHNHLHQHGEKETNHENVDSCSENKTNMVVLREDDSTDSPPANQWRGEVTKDTSLPDANENFYYSEKVAATVETSVQTDEVGSKEDNLTKHSQVFTSSQEEVISTKAIHVKSAQKTEETKAQSGCSLSTSSELETSASRSGWWLKALLLGLLLLALFYFLAVLLFPEDCNNSCYHCGVFDLRRKYYSIPSH